MCNYLSLYLSHIVVTHFIKLYYSLSQHKQLLKEIDNLVNNLLIVYNIVIYKYYLNNTKICIKLIFSLLVII
jgi:hypothetical protein